MRKIFCAALAVLLAAAGASGQAGSKRKRKSRPASRVENYYPLLRQSVAGLYELDTYEGAGEGLVNSLSVEDEGGAKIRVFFSAASIYAADGAATSREASGGGELRLSVYTARGAITEEGDKIARPCHLTIVFGDGQASVKTGEDCGFSVPIDGVYKKPKVAERVDKTVVFPYERLAEFVGDDDRQLPGTRFSVGDVPVFNKVSLAGEPGNRAFNGLFRLSAAGEANHATSFLASKRLVDAMLQKLNPTVRSLRVEGTLVVVAAGAGEAYRTTFATRVEGFDADGKTLWTVEDIVPPPVKIA